MSSFVWVKLVKKNVLNLSDFEYVHAPAPISLGCTGKQKLENFEILQLIYHTKIARICGKFYDGASYFLAHHQFCPCLALNAVYVHTIIA